MIEVRPFVRADREQLSRLVNAHVAAAVPGGSLPAATLLNDLERPVGEEVIGPWVTELTTLVAGERDRLVAAAHLRRYTAEARAADSYRDATEIRWLAFWPDHGGANLAFAGWADECNHWVREDLRGRGIGSWLVAHAAQWLRLGGTTRLMAYVIEGEPEAARLVRYWARHGLCVVNRTTRGWHAPR